MQAHLPDLTSFNHISIPQNVNAEKFKTARNVKKHANNSVPPKLLNGSLQNSQYHNTLCSDVVYITADFETYLRTVLPVS